MGPSAINHLGWRYGAPWKSAGPDTRGLAELQMIASDPPGCLPVDVETPGELPGILCLMHWRAACASLTFPRVGYGEITAPQPPGALLSGLKHRDSL